MLPRTLGNGEESQGRRGDRAGEETVLGWREWWGEHGGGRESGDVDPEPCVKLPNQTQGPSTMPAK